MAAKKTAKRSVRSAANKKPKRAKTLKLGAAAPASTTRYKKVARPDVVDFRDAMFTPTLVEVPLRITLDEYKKAFVGRVPVLDQREEGACTGFGLAAVAHYLLHKRKIVPDRDQVSPHMLYEMAKRYDEWRGRDYEGSSARGAMKGWHKHGVCALALWQGAQAESETHAQAVDAAKRPLGAYFRVNHKDLVAMHAALAEVGVLYATATVHTGWDEVKKADGRIPYSADVTPTGGHAFAIVGYDEAGFWIQNSWGPSWGKGGFAQISYTDWLRHGSDVWVARLGAPVTIGESSVRSSGAAQSMASRGYTLSTLRPHVIGIGNDGLPRKGGELGTTKEDIERIFTVDFPRITRTWSTKRVLFYAHGGLVSEKDALQRVEDYRKALLDDEVYPIAFVWRTDAWNTIKNLLSDLFSKRRAEGPLDAAKDFMLDRVDDSLEVVAAAPGGLMWGEMKENALAATRTKKIGGDVSVHQDGGARLALQHLKTLLEKHPGLEVHLAAHSAGSIFLAPFAQAITTAQGKLAPLAQMPGLGAKISSCALWAPACTVDLFERSYLPAINGKAIQRFSLFTLKDAAEQDDHCARIYNKSLLYLVSNAFELETPLDLFRDGKPILGMEKFILKAAEKFGVDPKHVRKDNPSEVQLFGLSTAEWVRCPNSLPEGDASASGARHHGAFDDDQNTVQATLRRILGRIPTSKPEDLDRAGAAACADRRRLFDEVLGYRSS